MTVPRAVAPKATAALLRSTVRRLVMMGLFLEVVAERDAGE
jgi:hypothetical protein